MGRHLGKTISCCSHVLRTKKAEIDELLKNTCAELRSEENEKDLNVCVCIAPIFLLFYVYTRRVSLRADGYPHVKVHAWATVCRAQLSGDVLVITCNYAINSMKQCVYKRLPIEKIQLRCGMFKRHERHWPNWLISIIYLFISKTNLDLIEPKVVSNEFIKQRCIRRSILSTFTTHE